MPGRCLLLLAMILLAACASTPPAPVIARTAPSTVVEPDRSALAATPADALVSSPVAVPVAETAGAGFYTVKKGDTLYSIALDNGHSYRDIAAWNALEDPNRIQVGQQLRVAPPEGGSSVAVARPITAPGAVEARPLAGASPSGAANSLGTPSANTETLKREPKGGKLRYSDQALATLQKPDAPAASAAPVVLAAPAVPALAAEAKPEAKPEIKPATADSDVVDWAWPAGGKLIAGFVDGGNKGVDIAAKPGDPVLAAATGKVVYSGSGLRGYGKLVIIKHNPSFLSAYAHNSLILVKEGQGVNKGQKIAEAGASDSDQPMLHFEIRRQGKPVDPLKFLPSR